MALTPLGARMRAYVSKKEEMLSRPGLLPATQDSGPGGLSIEQPATAREAGGATLALAPAAGVVPAALQDPRALKLAELLLVRQEALSAIEAALRRDADDMQSLQRAASCMGRLGQTDRALAILRQCIAVHPRSDWPRAQLSGLYLQKAGEVQGAEVQAMATEAIRAIETWNEITSDVDKDREYVRNLVPALLLQRNLDAAAGALARFPDDFACLRAMVEYARGHAPAVEATLRAIMRPGENPITIFCELTQALAFRGDVELAFECAQQVQALVMQQEDGFYCISLSELVNSPFVGNLKIDPRWPDFVHSIGQSQAGQLQFNYEPSAA